MGRFPHLPTSNHGIEARLEFLPRINLEVQRQLGAKERNNGGRKNRAPAGDVGNRL